MWSKGNRKVHEASHPGEYEWVIQMESSQAGFFAQLKRKLTAKWYKAMSVFMGH